MTENLRVSVVNAGFLRFFMFDKGYFMHVRLHM